VVNKVIVLTRTALLQNLPHEMTAHVTAAWQLDVVDLGAIFFDGAVVRLSHDGVALSLVPRKEVCAHIDHAALHDYGNWNWCWRYYR
jgi:hypothetical protein